MDDKTDLNNKKLSKIKKKIQASTVLNYIEFKSLIENIQGSKKLIDVVLQYTNDFKSIRPNLLVNIYTRMFETPVSNIDAPGC